MARHARRVHPRHRSAPPLRSHRLRLSAISGASSRNRRIWASRSNRRCSSSVRPDAASSSALVSRTAPGIGAVSAATRSATVASSSADRADDGGQPDARGLGRADHPRGGADLQCPGVANALDQRLCSRQVGHQPERGLLHAELGVVGHHPQVAGQRELEAGADGVALHDGDRDEARVAQPGEAALERLDGRRRLLVGLREQRRDRLPPSPAAGRVEHRAVEAGREASARRPRSTTTRTSSGISSPIAASARHIAGVWALRTSGRSRVTVATAPSTSYRRPARRAPRESCGHCRSATDGRTRAVGDTPERAVAASAARRAPRSSTHLVIAHARETRSA